MPLKPDTVVKTPKSAREGGKEGRREAATSEKGTWGNNGGREAECKLRPVKSGRRERMTDTSLGWGERDVGVGRCMIFVSCDTCVSPMLSLLSCADRLKALDSD